MGMKWYLIMIWVVFLLNVNSLEKEKQILLDVNILQEFYNSVRFLFSPLKMTASFLPVEWSS